MPILAGPDGSLDYLVTGDGAPVTVFGHGLAGSIAETRPFGSGVDGTRAFFHFRGHGESQAPDRAETAGDADANWTYDDLAGELRWLSERLRATRAVGVSLGAGALIRLVAETLDRFERLVLMLPASLDRPRPAEDVERLARMADRVETGDVRGLAQDLRLGQPEGIRDRPEVVAWSSRRARELARTPVARALRSFATAHPLTDRRVLTACRTPVLVVAQQADDSHPVETARELAEVLPAARLEVVPPGGPLWTHRRAVRELVAGFLNDPPADK